MPADSVNFNLLHRTCKLVVLLCLLHIFVTVVFYVRSLDIRFAFVQNQQNYKHTASGQKTGGVTQTESDRKLASGANGTIQQSLTQSSNRESGKVLEKCPETSPLLVGPLRVEFNSPVSLDFVKKENQNVEVGGRFRPRGCLARQKVAIIIPFRHREEHLKYWLYYLHPILQRQQLDYGVYVIQQDGEEIFNRAKLLNVGYVESLKEYDYECFVFSDVDLIPMDDRNTYTCFSQPRHLSVSMDKFGFRLPYKQYFGGVSSMSKEQYLKINGFPNNYWGWGGEDDDIYNRLSSKGMSISRPAGDVGKCRMIRHSRDKKNDPNPQRFNRIAHTRETMGKDGINSLQYRLVKKEKLELYTMVTVDVGKP
ncbi:beta-1,4-galactosyltransferase 1 isoform X1 [Synchiropus splendidus]|uniref:beta-1,4-galactosyltransferase 1 isoform X1 n=1 Tax=Synchiropus splendidus TaxID=270530 RepID=UPI00237E693B|nr:beta-1,4-galactosyltransferase 1 isoform X1 [Synchiropus splendidus]XP_053734686.1 beta-1,4-galactosyltransferase 1 isoform X1 [Synchiropus splendidus]XP_053734687.1 beta-1,4-galactosyltransferase 1 isoform X1 [Synchiropus splendidus]